VMACSAALITHLQQNIHSKSDHLAKPNFQYEKRQKELEKKRKKEEKLKRKLEKGNAPDDSVAAEGDDDNNDAEQVSGDLPAADR